MATSKTDIANISLLMVGGDTITSFTQGTRESGVVQIMYPALLETMLRFPWNFATQRKKLAQSSTVPGFGFDHAYPLPSDWVRTISVHGNDIGVGTIAHRAEQVGGQNVIVTSHDEVWLRYIKSEIDPNLMTADFKRAFQVSLARDMAIPIANSRALFADLTVEAIRAVANARSTDAMESFPEQRPRGSWITARNGWRNGAPHFL